MSRSALTVPWVALCMCGCTQSSSHRVIQTPQLSPASTEAAARVDRVGRQLVAGSPFLFGNEPTWQTVGSDEPEIVHQDGTGLFITEGLVNLCKSDDQLAAVLATELGHMVGERRRTERMNLPEPIPTAATLGSLDGTATVDPGRTIELADLEKNYRRPAEKRLSPTSDPDVIAQECYKDAGFNPKEFGTVEPILRKARRNHKLAAQFAAPVNITDWLK